MDSIKQNVNHTDLPDHAPQYVANIMRYAQKGVAYSVVVLLPVASQPRYHKRIRGLQKVGMNVYGFCFNRPYFRGAPLPCKIERLGTLKHGSYLKRFFNIIFSSKRLTNKIADNDVIYAFGADMVLLALLMRWGSSNKIIYEIGDLRPAHFASGILSSLVRALERYAVKRAHVVVVTARGFADEFICRHLGASIDKIRVIENKLDLPSSGRPTPALWQPGNPITIGYFGLLRCKRSWRTLKEVVRLGQGSVKVLVWGYPLGVDIKAEAEVEPFVEYRGEFVSPDDLASMYSGIDLVWGCYPTPDHFGPGNWRWARTNRFYEACYFRRPIVALSGTDEADEVEALQIGMGLDLRDCKKAASRLLSALPENLHSWQSNVAKVLADRCVYVNEHENLVKSLSEARL